jgi:two-component sensor histidine kinase
LKEQSIRLLHEESELQQQELKNARLQMQVETQAREQEKELALAEARRKDQEFIVLQQNAIIQESVLSRIRTSRNIYVGGAMTLLLVLGLGYNRYRLKQRTNREISQKNRALQNLIDEKNWLLKEVHHRVKNNLQTVLSLLESQSRKLSSEAMNALQESQNRVYAMSLIHKKLYQSADVASINMEDYLRDLVQHLREGLGGPNKIRYLLLVDPIDLDVSQAVPIGLIVNEAITNSIKYAFPNVDETSEIRVKLEKAADDRIILQVHDNGIGIIEPNKNTQSLGLKLMRGLAEDIEGTFSIASRNGVAVTIEFIGNTPFQKVTQNLLSRRAMQTV